MSSDDSLPPVTRTLPAHALIFGGVSGALGAGLNWAQFAFGFYGRAAWIVLLFVPLIAIILGVQRWRDGVLGGAIRFPQAFSAALAIGLVYALIQWGFASVLVHHLEPGLLDAVATFQREAMQSAGRAAEEIAAAEKEFREQLTPAVYAKSIFAFNLIVAFIGALLASLFMRRIVR
jgi:hypothetical protein